MIVFGLISAIGILADIAIRMSFYSRMGRDRQSGQLGMILVLAGVIGMIIAWLIGPLVSAAVSRQREYLADASGIQMTRYPEGLASALQKLGEYGKPMKRANSAMAHMYINDPLKPGLVERAFSTHPPIPKRVERLNQIGTSF
jgi:heat shock protein HtpX